MLGCQLQLASPPQQGQPMWSVLGMDLGRDIWGRQRSVAGRGEANVDPDKEEVASLCHTRAAQRDRDEARTMGGLGSPGVC